MRLESSRGDVVLGDVDPKYVYIHIHSEIVYSYQSSDEDMVNYVSIRMQFGVLERQLLCG